MSGKPAVEPSVTIRHEFPSCIHVAVSNAVSERSAVALARNFASRHYGTEVGHYVSSGWSEGASTYVFSNPGYLESSADQPSPPEPRPAKRQAAPVPHPGGGRGRR